MEEYFCEGLNSKEVPPLPKLQLLLKEPDSIVEVLLNINKFSFKHCKLILEEKLATGVGFMGIFLVIEFEQP
jgi:hypothetical protein